VSPPDADLRATLEVALMAMGYRKGHAGFWLKPVGYVGFAVNIETREWKNVFRDQKGKLNVYDSHPIRATTREDCVREIKDHECCTRVDLCPDTGSKFEFLSWAESIEAMLDGEPAESAVLGLSGER
jgi:hypothetical protein